MSGDSGQDETDPELEQRVKRLEANIEKMMPTRRDVLKGTGMAALGAAGMYSVTGGAQAQTQAAGQVGTEGNRVDLFANDVDANTILESRTSAQTETINVPSDFSTVANAVADVVERRTPPGVTIEINIESGHSWQDPVEIEQQDLRHVTITSEDATVSIDTGNFPTPDAFNYAVTASWGGVAPIINVTLDCQDHADGFRSNRGGLVMVDSGGAPNGASRGLSVGNYAFGMASFGDFSGSGENSVSVSSYGMLLGNAIDATGAGEKGLRVGAARADCEQIDVSNSGDVGVDATATANVDVDSITANNCSGNAISAIDSAVVKANNAEINGAGGFGISANGAYVSAEEATIDDCDRGVSGRSRVDLFNASITNNTNYGVNVLRGGVANLWDATVSGSGDTDIRIRFGGVVVVDGTTTTNSTGGEAHESDMNVPPNTVQGEGIIFGEATES